MLRFLRFVPRSVPETKVNIVKVIRSILRENVRRNMGTLERGCKARLAPLRGTLPSSAKLGETAETPDAAVQSQRLFRVTRPPCLSSGSSRAFWLSKQPLAELSAQTGCPRLGADSDEGSLSSGTYSLSGAPPSSASPVQDGWSGTAGSSSSSQARSPSAVKESDILSDEDDDGFSEGGARRGSGDSSSPTSAIEAQFLRLELSASRAPAPRVQPEELGDTPETQPKLLRGRFGAAEERKPSSQGALVSTKAHSRSLEGRAGAGSPSGLVDLNALLEREFSVQSLTSVVNEDCFYDPAEGGGSGRVPSA